MRLAPFIGAAVIGLAAAFTNAGIVDVQQFNLFNHPDGQIDPQAYGLRLDSFGPGAVTFSFEDMTTGDSNVKLIVREFASGLITIQITGEVWGNSATSGSFIGTFDLDVTYTVAVNPGTAAGWIDPDAGPVDIGFLTQLTDSGGGSVMGTPLTINTRSAIPFLFLEDGHRISGDGDTWVGRGWVQGSGSTNDFLFTAVIVPLPSAALAGLAGLMLLGGVQAHRRRR